MQKILSDDKIEGNENSLNSKQREDFNVVHTFFFLSAFFSQKLSTTSTHFTDIYTLVGQLLLRARNQEPLVSEHKLLTTKLRAHGIKIM